MLKCYEYLSAPGTRPAGSAVSARILNPHLNTVSFADVANVVALSTGHDRKNVEADEKCCTVIRVPFCR